MGATVTYNGSVIAELNGGQTKKLLTGGKYLEGDLTVEAVGGGGGDANIVPLLIGEIGTYNENSPVVVSETFTGEGEPDAVLDYYGISLPFFKAKKLVATPDIGNLVKIESLADKLYVNLFGEVIPLCWMDYWVGAEGCIIRYDGIPAIVWLLDNDYLYTQEAGFEVGGVYVVDAWSLLGATGEISLTALGTPDKVADGFMPVTVGLPVQDELVITPSRGTEIFDEGYYKKVQVSPVPSRYLRVKPSTKEQYFDIYHDDYGKPHPDSENIWFSAVTVEAVDLTEMQVLCDIELSTLPKTEYKVGDGLDTTEGIITLHYTDGSTELRPLFNQYIYGWKKATDGGVGTHTLIVQYTENGITCRTTYDITITE